MREAGELAGFFHALSDLSRLRIVQLVRTMELTVGELCQVLGQSQPRVSRHVRILDEAGIVRRRREGSWTFVEIPRGPVPGLLDPLVEAVAGANDREIFTADLKRLGTVRDDREAAASRWFDSRAERWEAVRALHAGEDEIEAALAKALGRGPLGTLVDVGTGTGRMIELFGPRSTSAIGIDRSPDMLRLARVRLDKADASPAQLLQGDMNALPLDDGIADTLILHLVLHYAASPAAALAEAARVLKPGGRLLLVDFAEHDREELRRIHGHQRLGFSDAQVEDRCNEVGLELAAVSTVAGDPLDVRLWTARRPAKEAEAA